MSSLLKLLLVKPRSSVVKIRSQECIDVSVNVICENIGTCFVGIKYDNNCFELVEGVELNSLGGGSFTKEFSWMLKAKEISEDSHWIEIVAEAGNLKQAVGFNVKIVKN